MGKNLSTKSLAEELFFDRFPKAGLMLSGISPKEPLKEKLPSFDIEKADLFYFYGVGRGEIYPEAKAWLERKKGRKLVILEDDLNTLAFFLSTELALEALHHPQVFFEYWEGGDEEIELLSQKYPCQRVEVAFFPSKKKGEELRLSLLRKTTLSYALHADRLYGYQPFQNFIENLKILPHSFYANGLKRKFQNVPAVVCGAGPSLEKTVGTLSQLEDKALLIAGGSTLAALSAKGIRPHLGVAIDPNLEEYRRMKNSFLFEVPLLYSTRVHPGTFQTCSGPFGYMRSGIGGLLELWIEEELGLEDPLLGENLSFETISVTGICLALAVELGCNPILINGVDLAYTNDRHYASGVMHGADVEYEEINREKTAADQIFKKMGRNGKPVSTAVRWIMEASSISSYAESHPEVTFINTTEGGLGFKGIDYQPIEKASLEFKEASIRKKLLHLINSLKMEQNTEKKISASLNELYLSVKRCIEHLKVLADQKEGSKVLSEVELFDELASDILFYDVKQLFKQDAFFWKSWLSLAENYFHIFEKSYIAISKS